MTLRAASSKVGYVLLALHVLVVYGIYAQHFEGSWGGFVLFLIDLPISLLSFFIEDRTAQWTFFYVVGSIWWYVVGSIVESGLHRLLRR